VKQEARRTQIDLIWLLVIILIVGWLLGGFVFHLGGLIHLLLVIILILITYRLVTGRRVA
jgi:membrane protein implicated in regulation of membrane protease activity